MNRDLPLHPRPQPLSKQQARPPVARGHAFDDERQKFLRAWLAHVEAGRIGGGAG